MSKLSVWEDNKWKEQEERMLAADYEVWLDELDQEARREHEAWLEHLQGY